MSYQKCISDIVLCRNGGAISRLKLYRLIPGKYLDQEETQWKQKTKSKNLETEQV